MRLFDTARRGFRARKGEGLFPTHSGSYGSWPHISTQTGPTTWASQLGRPMDNSIVAILLSWYVKNWHQAKPVIARQRPGQDDVLEYKHAVLDLLSNPNPHYGPGLFWEAMIQDKKLDGTALAQIVPDKYGVPAALYWLPTESMIPVYDSDGSEWIKYWQCTTAGKTRKLAPEEVLVWQEGKDDQYGGRKGYSRFKAGIAEAVGDNEARNTVNAFFRNRAEMGTIISPSDRYLAEIVKGGGNIEDALLTPMQAREIEAKVNAKNQGEGKFSLNVFNTPMAITQLMSALKDLDMSVIWSHSESRLAGLFGIHPVVAGLSVGLDASSDKHNMEAAQEMSWKNGIIPDQDSFCEVVNTQLMPVMELNPDKARFDFDRSDVEALQEDADARSTRVLSQWKENAITHGEMRTDLGKKVDPELKDMYFKDIQAAQAEHAAEIANTDEAKKSLIARGWREKSRANGIHN